MSAPVIGVPNKFGEFDLRIWFQGGTQLRKLEAHLTNSPQKVAYIVVTCRHNNVLRNLCLTLYV